MRQNATEFTGCALALIILKLIRDKIRKRDALGKLKKMKTHGEMVIFNQVLSKLSQVCSCPLEPLSHIMNLSHITTKQDC